MKLAILLTVYNRRVKTLTCLQSIFAQHELPSNLISQVFLVDDGCTDGTPQEVCKQFPKVIILPGTGNLFWCGGMRLAFATALQEGYDFYLWLNDDTILFENAIFRLLVTSKIYGHQAIVVASTKDAVNNNLTYGGVRRSSGWRRLHFDKVPPEDQPIPVETMNGNCVLVPQLVAQRVGNLDPAFTHRWADYDYGLRARQLGVEIVLAPDYYGYCAQNESYEKVLSRKDIINRLISPLFLPPKEWAVFARRYSGLLWPIFWIHPYLKLFRKSQLLKYIHKRLF
jgi:GT2 family glycosyltransferase